MRQLEQLLIAFGNAAWGPWLLVLSSAMAGTIGMGNIAGVAVAGGAIGTVIATGLGAEPFPTRRESAQSPWPMVPRRPPSPSGRDWSPCWARSSIHWRSR